MAFTTDQNKTSRLCTMAENTPTYPKKHALQYIYF